MRVSINVLTHNGNASRTCPAFAKGIERAGDKAIIRSDRDHDMQGFDACVIWGYVTSCQKIIKACVAKRIPFVFVDLGYWQRERGYYKVAVNDRHPTAYILSQAMPNDRFVKLGLAVKDWRKTGSNILLAGMSGKAAWSWGLENESFEREAVRILRWHIQGKRTIIYRPKPSWRDAQSIPHTVMNRTSSINDIFQNTYCVVTHHSNVACEALLEGIPIFSKYGAAVPLGMCDISKVETPCYPEGREQWAFNLAYCQWTIPEMASGECWQHLKSVGLVK